MNVLLEIIKLVPANWFSFKVNCTTINAMLHGRIFNENNYNATCCRSKRSSTNVLVQQTFVNCPEIAELCYTYHNFVKNIVQKNKCGLLIVIVNRR